MTEYHILGLISGSSLDGIDLAHCRFKTERTADDLFRLADWSIDECTTHPFTAEWYDQLAGANQLSATQLLVLDAEFGSYLGQVAKSFIQQKKLHPDYIASHGHTVFHHPEKFFTCQIGAGAMIAGHSGIPTISRFRDQDIALGGQGAPVAPIADAWLFDKAITFFLNLGGIANISCRTSDGFIAFDITGCNQILNALASTAGLDYDEDGRMASQGQLVPALLEAARSLNYFTQSYPKSLDNQWVKQNQTLFFLRYDALLHDKLFTACQFIAGEIARSIQLLRQKASLSDNSFRLLATGGGALNQFLIQCIQNHCQPLAVNIEIPDKTLVEYKEAALIALMGLLRLHSRPNVMASVTGARRDTINGIVHLV